MKTPSVTEPPWNVPPTTETATFCGLTSRAWVETIPILSRATNLTATVEPAGPEVGIIGA